MASAGNRGENNCTEQNSADPKNPTYIVTPPWFSDYVISVAAMDRATATRRSSPSRARG